MSETQSVPHSHLLALNDKLVHLVLYGVLGCALGWGRRFSRAAVPHWALLAVGFAYGAVDEWHQSFVPRRHPSVADFGADVVGVTLGYVVLLGTAHLLRRRDPADPDPTSESDQEGRGHR